MGDLAPQVDVPAVVARIAAKTALSLIPVAGPLLTAVFDEVMPAFRAERLQEFATTLGPLIEDIPAGTLNERVREPERYDLLEDGLWQAARAASKERIDYIAHLVAGGLKAEDAKALDRRFLLALLGQLNDVEVLLLCAKGKMSRASVAEFYERHADVLDVAPAMMGSSTEVLDKDRLHAGYSDHLLRLGLLQESYTPDARKPPEFDRKGNLKGTHRSISYLGRMLLREVGQPAELDV